MARIRYSWKEQQERKKKKKKKEEDAARTIHKNQEKKAVCLENNKSRGNNHTTTRTTTKKMPLNPPDSKKKTLAFADVCFGRGRFRNNHLYRLIVCMHKKHYEGCSPRAKQVAIDAVLVAVKAAGGHFYEESNGCFSVVTSQRRIREKVAQALRQKRRARPAPPEPPVRNYCRQLLIKQPAYSDIWNACLTWQQHATYDGGKIPPASKTRLNTAIEHKHHGQNTPQGPLNKRHKGDNTACMERSMAADDKGEQDEHEDSTCPLPDLKLAVTHAVDDQHAQQQEQPSTPMLAQQQIQGQQQHQRQDATNHCINVEEREEMPLFCSPSTDKLQVEVKNADRVGPSPSTVAL